MTGRRCTSTSTRTFLPSHLLAVSASLMGYLARYYGAPIIEAPPLKRQQCSLRLRRTGWSTLSGIRRWLVNRRELSRSSCITTASRMRASSFAPVSLLAESWMHRTYSSFSTSSPPRVFSRSFVYPYGIRALAMSETRLGVTSRSLLITTDRESIVSIPRRLLDPRRPLSKPSKMDNEEGLLAYDALLPLDPKKTLSGRSPVLSSPLSSRLKSVSTMLESTSIVVSLGGDFWSGRLAPSGAFDVLSGEFNKVQLLLTMAALGTGILVTRPIVRTLLPFVRPWSEARCRTGPWEVTEGKVVFFMKVSITAERSARCTGHYH